MVSFRCYDNFNVISIQIVTNFHLSTTVMAIFPNVCLWQRSLCSNLVLTLKNCIEPPLYASMAYVVIWPSFRFDSFIKIWATCEICFGQKVYCPPTPCGKKFPVHLWVLHSFVTKHLHRFYIVSDSTMVTNWLTDWLNGWLRVYWPTNWLTDLND